MGRIVGLILGFIPIVIGLLLLVPNVINLFYLVMEGVGQNTDEGTELLFRMLRDGGLICLSLLIIAIVLAVRSESPRTEYHSVRHYAEIDTE